MRKVLLFLGYNVGVVLGLLVLSELVVRLFCPHIQPQGTSRSLFANGRYGSSPGLRPLSSGTSNGVEVNVDRYGFRACSVNVDPSKDSWLFLGDSVTMGVGVEGDSTFAGILHRSIDSINILNPSLLGYDVGDYANVLRYFVVGQRQDLNIKHVSIFWCLNDVYTDVADVQMPGGRWRYFLSDVLHQARIHSRLYVFLKSLLFDRSKSYFLFDKRYYTGQEEEFQRAIGGITQMHSACQDRKIRFDVLLLPYQYQLRVPSQENFLPQRLMINMLQGRDIDVYDPAIEAVRRNLSKELFTYGDGLHLSSAGHRYIADYVLRHLTP